MDVSDTGQLRREVFAFVALTLALSAIPYVFLISAGTMKVAGGAWVLAVMWCPGIAGMALQLYFRRTLRGMGWGWGSTRHQAISYVLPLVYATPVYVLVWSAGLGGFPNPEALEAMRKLLGIGENQFAGVGIRFLFIATVGVVTGLLSATGEEIGWRGFLVPRLATLYGPTRASLISGSIWALWHFPGIFFVDYNGGTPGWYSAIMFFVLVVSISFSFTWLRVASGSLWTGAILHASHNSFIQAFFDRVTIDTGPTHWITGEFGCGLALTAAVVAWWVYRRKFTNLSADSPAISPPQGT